MGNNYHPFPFKNRYTSTSFLLLLLFSLLTVFLFAKRSLEPPPLALAIARDFLPRGTNSTRIPSPFAPPPTEEQQQPTQDPEPEPEPEPESEAGGDTTLLPLLDPPQTTTEEKEQRLQEDPKPDPRPEPENEAGGDTTLLPLLEPPQTTTKEKEQRLQEDPKPEPENEAGGDPTLFPLLDPPPTTTDEKEQRIQEDPQPDPKTAPGGEDGGSEGQCDFYEGRWVKDDSYPLYEAGSCPYVDEAFECQGNGRRDSDYLKWRWKPNQCELPRFNATDFLMRLRGKRLMLVGDSMNRNQFESLLCLLREGLSDKSKMYEIHHHKITKGRGYYVFKFVDYHCTVEFVRSHFLVKEGIRINAQGNSNPTLSIDQIDKTSGRWKRADILVFNTGHWWTHGKTARGKNYYKEGDYLYPWFDALEAYRRALMTWARWIKANVKRKQLVFYRGYSSAHFRGGDWDSGGTCYGETEPTLSGPILDNYPPKMKIVEEVIQEVKIPVKLLNITKLTNSRTDGHPSIFGKNATMGKKVSRRRQDCSHWCLPGVPDAWNELIYATLVFQQPISNG